MRWKTTAKRCLLAAIAGLGGAHSGSADQQSITITGEINVYDGDTLEIGPILIRLHGIDAPEKGQRCATPDGGTWRCGPAASRRLAEIITEKTIACDALDRDPYGRIIARCTASGTDIASVLMQEGLA